MAPLPEQQAREQIDALLGQAGWAVQNYKSYDPAAARGIALREVPLAEGRCDYLLMVDRTAAGIIEAKKEGTLLSGVAEQSAFYAASLPPFLQAKAELRFLYESTGAETLFRDARDPEPRSRNVFAFHRPETLAEWLAEPDTLRARLRRMPPLIPTGMRACQLEAITHLEKSLAADKPRALIQMATGAGKTYTACAFTYRLIRHAGARRVLFLVDRANLGRQTVAEYQQYVVPDGNRKFTELYNVQHLTSAHLDPVCRVTVATIQRIYSMLSGKELPEDLDEVSGFEAAAAVLPSPEVQYNPAIPIETFDFIVTDECHRSIYNLWRQVLEYFDAYLIGLTATPSKQTIGFFKQNLVMEYGHERAVADGVNVGYDVYRIRTDVTERGATVEAGNWIDKRSRETRKTRWERLDEDLAYEARALDRSVVVPSQIRTVLEAWKQALPALFPGRTLVPKTLIFAKDDSHAEDIVHVCREVFGKGNDFCKKITYKTYNPDTRRYEKSEHLIQEFRTSPQLRIAVTVDMIATGTDIKPLECLVFLRDVKSRVYFEQMKGRGTRVLSPTDLQAVSGAEARAKTHFVIVDAVGVCESDKTDSRPLEKKPKVAFDKLMLGVAFGKRDEASLTSLAGRLARLDRELDHEQRKHIRDLACGASVSELANRLLDAVDPDKITTHAQSCHPERSEGSGPTKADLDEARESLITAACTPFDNPVLRDTLANLKRETEQTIDTVTQDQVIEAGFDAQAKEQAESLTRGFRAYIEQHKAEIEALHILYSRPYRQRITEEALKDLEAKLQHSAAHWTPDALWHAYRQTQPHKVKGQVQRFTDLISLVRFAWEREPVLEPFEDHVRSRYAQWLQAKQQAGVEFTADELAWLEKMRDYIIASGSVDRDHLEADHVLGPLYRVFGERLWPLMDELNLALAA
ncbi:MAG: DEAD/DEAH box helicase family protein [Gammaproteobacteria bacterium]|nr:DEAD/DEAH box helicase family protein [Gammaproteobacteria bacterium]